MIMPVLDPLIVIPARMHSERLPGKPLLEVKGIPLLAYTYAAARHASRFVVVATEDNIIQRFCQQEGWPCIRTPQADNGTCRVAMAAAKSKVEERKRMSCVVNWQVDAPTVDPADIAKLAESLQGRRGIATLAYNDIVPEGIVSVATSNGIGHWFSRGTLRGGWQHIGVYAYRFETLFRIAKLPLGHCAVREDLEQLTWIEGGNLIGVVEATRPALPIDTAEDLLAFEGFLDD